MKYASEDLMNEHEGILFGLKILEKMVSMMKNIEKVEHDDLIEMVNFLKLFADKCHHGKEEGILFPAMEKVGIQNENGPIGQMLIEHAKGREYIKKMSAALNDQSFDINGFIESASRYIELLRTHIKKENTVLFPLGDKMIPMGEQTELLVRFEEHEEKVMGKGTHEKLHETLHQFQNKYL